MKNLKGLRFNIVGFAIVFIITMIIISSTDKAHREDINSIISNNGGTIINIDSRNLSIGPFHYNKNTSIYKINYSDKYGVSQEVWVRYGAFGTDWIWDYKEEM